jgi:1,4-alpha-glucan branching enzyme
MYTPEGVAAFARDQGSTKEVWSAEEGFPGDWDYREFYRDLGHDLDLEYIQPFLAGGVRCDTGIKYYRITGPTPHKQPYNPEVAREKAAAHAQIFLDKRVAHIEYLRSVMGAAPMITAPFDAELFGHWWFEGPQWLEYVIRKAAYDQNTLELSTPSRFLERHPVHQEGEPASSTWGHSGYFETWLNGSNDWIYNQLVECGRHMEHLADKHGRGRVSPLVERALNQCLRELLLAQSSDWPFIISNGTSSEYAGRRARDHVSRFKYLAKAVEAGEVDEEHLGALEHIDKIFPAIDFRKFRSGASQG